MNPQDYDLFTVVNLENDPTTGEDSVDQLKNEIEMSRTKNAKECDKAFELASKEEFKDKIFTYGIVMLGVIFLVGILVSFLISVSNPTPIGLRDTTVSEYNM